MKLFRVLALALTALAGGFAVPAFGMNNIYLVPQYVSKPVGQTFALACSISRIGSEPVGISGWTVRLFWNGAILHLVSVPNGGFLTGIEINQGDTTVAYWDRAVATLSNPQHATKGLLCTWNFQVKATGSCSIRFDTPSSYNTALTDSLANYFDPADITVRSGFFSYPSGVEEGQKQGVTDQDYKVFPNPFASFATVPGHEGERFVLYDITGKRMGSYQGDRIGGGVMPGVYFLRPESSQGKLLRIVKLR